MQRDEPVIGADMVIGYTLLVAWPAGILLANGFWSALAAFLFPPWAWILVVGRILGWT